MRSARSVVLLATLLALCSFSVAAVAGLAATERELVKRVQAQEQSSIALLELLKQHKIKPLVARRLPLVEARRAHELLGAGGVTGKIVLVCNGSSFDSRACEE